MDEFVMVKCAFCGKEFKKKARKRVTRFCSGTCAAKDRYYKKRGTNAISKTKYEKKPEIVIHKVPRKKTKTIAQINALARAEGLSYGQYVGKYGY